MPTGTVAVPNAEHDPQQWAHERASAGHHRVLPPVVTDPGVGLPVVTSRARLQKFADARGIDTHVVVAMQRADRPGIHGAR
jgi:hypothetical protein